MINFVRSRFFLPACALALAFFFIFFRITRADFTGDDAYYSVRSIGLLDYMFVDIQPTPIQWFERVPWWGRLSFHDHPLLLFLIQHLSFSFFGVSALSSKLPFALLALGALAMSCFWMRRYRGERVAAIGALFIAMNPDFIWAGRTAVLDAGVMFFLALSLLSFWLFLENRRWWWLCGLSLGLLLEAKWTTLFVFPACAAILFFFHRARLRERETWLAAALAAVLTLPLIAYNAAMFAARGHASLQLARLLGGNSPWKLAEAFPDALAPLGLFGSMSPPLFIVSVAATAFALYKRRNPRLLIFLGFLLLQTIFIGTHPSLFVIIFAPLTGDAVFSFLQWSKMMFWPRISGIFALILLAAYLFVYNINSFFLPNQFGTPLWMRMSRDTRNYGIYQLDRYLDDFLRAVSVDRLDSYRFLKVKQAHLSRYLDPAYRPNPSPRDVKTLVIFDDTLHWSPRVWLFERRIFYNNLALFPLSLAPLLRDLGMAPEAVYYIHATDNALIDGKKLDERARRGNLEERVARESGTPAEIRRSDGAVAFRVYRTALESLH